MPSLYASGSKAVENESNTSVINDAHEIDTDNIFNMLTQPLPISSTPKAGKASIPREPKPLETPISPNESDDEDIFNMLTQPMPTVSSLKNARKSAGILLTQKRTATERDDVSPETDDDSKAKLIPKDQDVIEAIVSEIRAEERGKQKQKWMFVSSSDEDEEDENEEDKKPNKKQETSGKF